MTTMLVLFLPVLLASVAPEQDPTFDDASESADHWCATVPVAAEHPPGSVESRSATPVASTSSASCDGRCVVDIAFLYDGSALDGEYRGGSSTSVHRDPESLTELRTMLRMAVEGTTAIFQRSGIDAEFRLIGIEPYYAPRRAFDADLVYEVEKGKSSATLGKRGPDGSLSLGPRTDAGGRIRVDGGLRFDGGGHMTVHEDYETGKVEYRPNRYAYVLAHEIGHNLGLAHNAPNDAAFQHSGGLRSSFPGGYGYRGKYAPSPHYRRQCTRDGKVVVCPDEWYSTIMAYWGATPYLRFSTSEMLWNGRRIGDRGQHESVSVIRRNLPRLAARVDSRVVAGPDYGCYIDDDSACLVGGRFEILARFLDPGGDYRPSRWRWGYDSQRGVHRYHSARVYNEWATRSLYFTGDSSALFHFFTPNNVELLVKVLDGCRINGKWWVFASAATDLQYAVKVFDLATGEHYIFEPEPTVAVGDVTTVPCR